MGLLLDSELSCVSVELADRMKYISVMEWAERHRVSERAARNYCAQGKVESAYPVKLLYYIS